MRGDRPTLRVIDGSDSEAGDHARESVAVLAADPVPPAPSGLPAELGGEWENIIRDLRTRRLFQQTMLGTIEQYLIALWGVRRAQASIEQHGELIPGREGVLKANPSLGLLRTSQDTAARLAAELGLTPTSRSRKSLIGVGQQMLPLGDEFDL